MSEKTENNKERITKMIGTAFIECYKEGFDDGKKEMLDKIRTEIETISSRYTIGRERGAMGQVEWSDRLIKESEILQIIDKYKAEGKNNIRPTNGSIFLKIYPDSHLSNIAYDDGICYVYVDLGGSRTRFTSDWWNASYKEESEE